MKKLFVLALASTAIASTSYAGGSGKSFGFGLLGGVTGATLVNAASSNRYRDLVAEEEAAILRAERREAARTRREERRLKREEERERRREKRKTHMSYSEKDGIIADLLEQIKELKQEVASLKK